MKTVLWTSPTLHSAEFFRLTSEGKGFHLQGTVNLLLENQPSQVVYQIDCDHKWITRGVELRLLLAQEEKSLVISVDDNLNWYLDGKPIMWARGFTDVDLSITPSTNLLPMNKHNLQIGESCTVNCVWVHLPSLRLDMLPQRYTRTDALHYNYVAESLGYNAVLTVDDEGMITKYGDLWYRP